MPLSFDSVIPWGRSYNEYRKMFNLQENDLKSKILGCGDGPASFNYEMTEMGFHVISIDPIYEYNKEQIEKRIEDTYREVRKQIEINKDYYLWNEIHSVDELCSIRLDSMKQFINDYNKGKSEKRYIAGELPVLPFKNNLFDICLCSHLLFLFSEKLDLNFHIQSVKEMLRVSYEIRIFPIVDFKSEKSKYVEEVVQFLNDNGFNSRIEKANYEFQKNANELLIIWKNKKIVEKQPYSF